MLRAVGQAGAIKDLGSVAAISRQTFDEYTTFRCRTQPPCLEYLSLLIETAILLRAHRGGRIYVGFERLSRLEPIVARFLRIADVSEQVYIFGEPDWQPPRHPNMRVLGVAPDAKLAREWFIIADSPALCVALIAVDEDGLDAPALDARNFDACKSSDSRIVAQLVAAAEHLIDATFTTRHAQARATTS
ncbi:MAG TPA: DICT sensory domain-containing protein [Pyrinomonadaceae bacterium]